MEPNSKCKDCSLIEKCPHNYDPLLWIDNSDRMSGRGAAERCHTSLTHREIKHSLVKSRCPNVQF